MIGDVRAAHGTGKKEGQLITTELRKMGSISGKGSRVVRCICQ